ncbi:unnamed protein product [Thlaspi arvense]|uniref:Factor of DNA methylation 1-5/IDN2 domain-containing protein n=1 Tax=Thlaspi arvense TaxID=13288 RepID=A0AAU9SPQ6_THLAR|nr:unnamed protein product [Thlaspi arvense]
MFKREGDRYMSFEGYTDIRLKPFPYGSCAGFDDDSASEEESETSLPSSPSDTPTYSFHDHDDSDSPRYSPPTPGRLWEPDPFSRTEDGRILVRLDDEKEPPPGADIPLSEILKSSGHLEELERTVMFSGHMSLLDAPFELKTRIEYEVDKEFCLSMITTQCRLKPLHQTPSDLSYVLPSDFDKLAVDDLFNGHMPWKFPNEMTTRPTPKQLDKQKYYVRVLQMKKSEVEENKEWLHLYVDLALFSQWQSLTQVGWAKPLELTRVIVQTREDVEPKDKVKAENAIFYIIFTTCHRFRFYAIIRRTTDGTPEHMSLEFKWFLRIQMASVHELQRKIDDYERKRFQYERKIARLENDLFEKDQEIIRAKFTLLQALPELNTPENDPLVDKLRVPGHLDPMMFQTACIKHNTRDPAMGNDRAVLEAEILCNEWRGKISDGVWELYITGPDQEEDDLVQVEMPDLLDLKDKYGEELYNAIKVAWIEAQEGRRRDVQLKPWDYEAGREQTLSNLLVPLQARIQFLKEQPLI